VGATDLNHTKVAIALATLLSVSLALHVITPVQGWDFSVNAEPEIRYASPGETVTYTVYVSLVAGPAEVIQLLVSPYTIEFQGLSFTFSPTTGTPPFVSTLYVTVSSTKAAGTYRLPVCGYNAHLGFRGDEVQLVVREAGPPFDFALALSPSALSVEQGGTATFRILVTYSSPAWSGTTITIQVTGLGPGMTWSSTMAGDLLIVTSTGTPPATYTITVVGSARGVMRQASAVLTVTPKAPPFDFSVTITPSTNQASLGLQVSLIYSVTVNLLTGTPSTVSLTLSGLPSGVPHTFTPQSGTPTFTSELLIGAWAISSIGTYTFTVTATGGGLSRTATATVVIKEARDFTVSVSPSTASVKQGGKINFNIAVNPIGGFDQTVTLSVVGTPSPETPVFTVRSARPPFTSTLTITVSSTTPIGAYSLIIEAIGADKTHSVKVALNVEKKDKEASSLSISVSLQGGEARVSGYLTPAVPGAKITLTYKADDPSVDVTFT